ncbi:interleukin-1 beta-like [Pyxicephalus adspersus]|uniref:interleukin-1 beta-like n=1 Tax=Pyxicephalus adspersus TaxID=30357 RepID=UPI003B58E097
MAEVPEIEDFSMDIYSEEEFYAECSSEKDDMNHLEWKFCVSADSSCRSITLEIQKPQKMAPSFKKAIKLILIIGKMNGRKGMETDCIFSDDDLLSHFLMEETITFNTVNETSAASPKFRYGKTTTHYIRDSRQKQLMRIENTHLVALFLQGGNQEKEEKINIGTYMSSPFKPNAQAVTLSIKDSNLYLCCAHEDGEPVLSLMEVENIQNKANNDLLPFLFYKRGNGSSSNNFESVFSPGWYICTSQTDNERVQMKPETDQTHIKDFGIYPVS